MPKRRKSPRRAERKAKPARTRNAALDSLRGLAIVLMIIDHAAGILLNVSIDYDTVRFWTRLSMPLFCVLMGFFLVKKPHFPDQRFFEIVLAALLINVLYLPLYREVEILGSLSVAYLLFQWLPRWFPYLVGAAVLVNLDLTRIVFDYPLTIACSFVAQGVILRRFGGNVAFWTGVFLSTGIAWFGWQKPSDVTHLLCYFILPATGLVHWGSLRPQQSIPFLAWLGRYPLTTYLTQYYILFAIAYWLANV